MLRQGRPLILDREINCRADKAYQQSHGGYHRKISHYWRFHTFLRALVKTGKVL